MRSLESSLRLPAGLLVLSILLLVGLTLWLNHVWFAVAIYHAIMLPISIWVLRDRLSTILKPGMKQLAAGLAITVPLYLASWGGFLLLTWLVPAAEQEAQRVFDWKDLVPWWMAAPILLLAVTGEELLWRGAITQGIASQWGRARGVIIGAMGFALAHAGMGSGLIVLAALLLGAFWGVLTLASRSLIPALVCHLLWDVAVLYFFPFA